MEGGQKGEGGRGRERENVKGGGGRGGGGAKERKEGGRVEGARKNGREGGIWWYSRATSGHFTSHNTMHKSPV